MDEVAYLSALPAVESVSESGRIKYAEWFKIEFLRCYWRGESPSRIFRRAGMDSGLLGLKRIERCSARWRENPELVAASKQKVGEELDSVRGGMLSNTDLRMPPGKSVRNVPDARDAVIRWQLMRIVELEQELALVRGRKGVDGRRV